MSDSYPYPTCKIRFLKTVRSDSSEPYLAYDVTLQQWWASTDGGTDGTWIDVPTVTG